MGHKGYGGSWGGVPSSCLDCDGGSTVICIYQSSQSGRTNRVNVYVRKSHFNKHDVYKKMDQSTLFLCLDPLLLPVSAAPTCTSSPSAPASPSWLPGPLQGPVSPFLTVLSKLQPS